MTTAIPLPQERRSLDMRKRSASSARGNQVALPFFQPDGRHLRPTGILERVVFANAPLPAPSFDTTWAPMLPSHLAIEALPHPTPLLQPTIHRAIQPPPPCVPVVLDRGIVHQGILSREQLALVARALDVHSRMHVDENGREIRLASLVALGTGSGKTSVALAVAEATRNLEQLNTPAIVVTSSRLIAGVFRTQGDEVGIESSRFHSVDHANIDALDRIDLDTRPYLLMTYAILRRRLNDTVEQIEAHLLKSPRAPYADILREALVEAKKERRARVSVSFAKLLMTLMPEDVLLVWDECDALRNGQSEQGFALREIDRARPQARMLFLSASPMPEAAAFGYLAGRLGLAGKNALFRSAAHAVEAATKNIRIAEILVAEGVALGTIVTGGLSFEGITYTTVTTETTDAQRTLLDAYRTLSTTMLEYARERLRHYSDLKYDAARFDIPTSSELSTLANAAHKNLLMDLCRPALFARIDAALEAGDSVVVEVARTGEALRQQTDPNGVLGTSGKQMIRDLVQRCCLPLKVRTITDNGKTILVDRQPERTKALRAVYDRTIDALAADDHILTDLATRYGSLFDEITGRSVRTSRVNGKFTLTPRKPARDNTNSIRKFADGEIRVVGVSEAGSRGIDLHAASTFKNRSKRRLLVFDPFVKPAEFLQIIGRVCRTGQVQWPDVEFFATDLPALSATLGTVVAKMRETGACTYGDRSSLRVHANALALKPSHVMAISLLEADLAKDPTLKPFAPRVKEINTVKGFVRFAAELPTCDRYPLQQRMWSRFVSACEQIAIKETDQTLFTADSFEVHDDELLGVPVQRITIEEPNQFVRTFEETVRRANDGDGFFLDTPNGPICAIPLPRYGNNPQEYRLIDVAGAKVDSLPLGTEISRERARELWDEAIAKVPRHRRHITVAKAPFAQLRTLDRTLSRQFGEPPVLSDVFMADNSHVFTARNGGTAIYGMYLPALELQNLELRAARAGLS